MDEIDFNIDNYNIDELIQLLNFDTIPTNEDMILHKINYLTRKYKEKPKYIRFFKEIGKKLILNFEHFNKETWQESYETDESLSATVLKQQYLDKEEDAKNLILDKNRDIIGIKKVSESKAFSTKNNTQGERNPVHVHEIRRIVNFDSQYREILNPISSSCTDVNDEYTNDPSKINNVNHINPEIRLYHPTNYTVHLNQPLINVVDISLESVEIPNSWYVFSSDYGTNSIEFSYPLLMNKIKCDIYLPAFNNNYSLIIENIQTSIEPKLLDPHIGIAERVKNSTDVAAKNNINWVATDDDSIGFFPKLTLPGGTILQQGKVGDEYKIYELWVGEYKTDFTTNNQLPTTTFKNEVGKNWRIRIKLHDDTGTPHPDFEDMIIDGVIPPEGVGLATTFIINYTPVGTPVKKKIEIENGNYKPDELMYAINNLCIFNNIPVEFSYSSINGKVSITNTDKISDTTIDFYIEDSGACSAQKTFIDTGSNTPSPGNKIGYNLGWLLGFRVKSIKVEQWKTVTSTSLLDTFGPKYFLLTLDDFNNNKPNKDLISLVDNSAKNFKLPKYYNSQTMEFSKDSYYPGHSATDPDSNEWKCKDIAGPEVPRGCSTNDSNKDLISNLTKKQQYTVKELTLANHSSLKKLENGKTLSTIVNRYKSPNSSDLLVRIPITNIRQDYTKPIVFQNRNPEYTKRIYFGPVKLRKFKIRLLNDKGFEVNLNDQDWSFSLHVTQLYQF
jgi:hypothetical protein